MIRLLAALLSFAVLLFAVYMFANVSNYAQVKMSGAAADVAAAMGYGRNVTVPQNYNLRIHNGTVSLYGSASTKTELVVEDSSCVVVANDTWHWHGCGPATVGISPGAYKIAFIRYPPMRRDFADPITQYAPVAVLAVLTLVAILLYERWR